MSALLLGGVDLLCISLFLRFIALRIRGVFHLAKPLELHIVFGNLRFEDLDAKWPNDYNGKKA